ncbi:hypothetical protein HGG75_23410 [Ochrobactrum pseudogrignonense]|nr:hypothetical protein [Brucella pseudogrignonensis]
MLFSAKAELVKPIINPKAQTVIRISFPINALADTQIAMLGRKSCVIGLMEMSAQRPALTIQTGVLSTFARPIGAPAAQVFG